MADSDLIVKGYVVGRQDDALLQEIAAETDTSKSAALRRIIREWKALQGRILVDTRSEYHADPPGSFITATIGE